MCSSPDFYHFILYLPHPSTNTARSGSEVSEAQRLLAWEAYRSAASALISRFLESLQDTCLSTLRYFIITYLRRGRGLKHIT